MAGYFRKLQGHVYNGEFPAGELMPNGVMATIVKNVETNAFEVKKITEADDGEWRVAQKTKLWGMPALVLDYVLAGTKENFFVENEWDLPELPEVDASQFELPIGKKVKMKRPLVGEQVITTAVVKNAYDALAEGDIVVFGADDLIVAKA